MRKIIEKIFGIILIAIGLLITVFTWMLGIKFFSVISFVLICGTGAVIAFVDHHKILELRTAKVHEMTSEGYIHTKDKTTHVSTYQDAVRSNHEYITRIQTPIGFYDVYDKDSYMSYKEGDKVKILVKTRYNKKDKPFMQEVTILGLLAPDIN